MILLDGLRVVEVVLDDPQLEADRLELGDRVAYWLAEEADDGPWPALSKLETPWMNSTRRRSAH